MDNSISKATVELLPQYNQIQIICLFFEVWCLVGTKILEGCLGLRWIKKYEIFQANN